MDTERARVTEIQASKILRKNRIERSPEDTRCYVEVALSKGLIELVPVCEEQSDHYSAIDRASMLRQGLVVETVAYGQRILACYEVETQ